MGWLSKLLGKAELIDDLGKVLSLGKYGKVLALVEAVRDVLADSALAHLPSIVKLKAAYKALGL